MNAGEPGFDRETFLAQYWQRKPLLIRNAIDAFATPLPADELAGLALEDDIESRIIDTARANGCCATVRSLKKISGGIVPGRCWCKRLTTTSRQWRNCAAW